ncbi:uncharacterized protein F5147DRAFT_725111 [Suillus discolor]|uniref:Uncharacterized protein n=1 Tax=Suillus discolor TaxID=1912936 RepID=A0A9P7EV82_9AGAM|nr:uncharacterized protein F5147DRAFT_725111 [Suillus discolor]KAG2090121.1 hypothetical protein F5147DRAFT_725111 [Suillus discolor]
MLLVERIRRDEDEEEIIQDGLRVEWSKARTRKEEIELLREEMRRVLQYPYFQWHVLWWNDMAHLCVHGGAEKEGVVAYTCATR